VKRAARTWIRRILLILAALILIFLAFEFVARRDALYNSIATTLYNLGKTDQAARLWEKRLDENDDDPIPEANYAKTSYRKGQHSEADELISKALSDDPDNPLLNYDRGNAQYRREDLDKALESYKKAMLADPHDQDAKSNYELVLNRKGYKKPTPQDQEQEQPQPQEPKSEYENTLNALDQKESNDRQEPGRPQEEPSERWW